MMGCERRLESGAARAIRRRTTDAAQCPHPDGRVLRIVARGNLGRTAPIAGKAISAITAAPLRPHNTEQTPCARRLAVHSPLSTLREHYKTGCIRSVKNKVDLVNYDCVSAKGNTTREMGERARLILGLSKVSL
jgi:hypothetical protein